MSRLLLPLLCLCLLALQPANSSAGYGSGGNEPPSISVATRGPLGPFLTDGSERPLYVQEPDVGAQPACDQECARIWPRFIADGTLPEAGAPEVQKDLIGSIELDDGRRQITYAGRPLHFHVRDTQASDTPMVLGQAMYDEWGAWHLVSPDGTRVEGLIDPRDLP